jgi:2-polyprenyl-6-methoxyphenol hydroxylase-like FAD-dependent oxidoreductase
VLATGPHPADPLLRSLGIERRMVSRHHSTTFGFDLRAGLSRVLTYYGEDIRDRMDYLTVFPMGQGLRANLFAYRSLHDPWTQAFASRPREALLGVMPSLARVLGGFEITGKVQARTNHLQRAENVRRDGVVLIGDAFQTSCPAAGTGIGRLLTDVETLLACLPRWLATPGLAAAKIGAFYDDPAKRAFDAEALRVARYRRDLCTQTNLAWQLSRARVHWQRKGRHLARLAVRGAGTLRRGIWVPPGPDLDLDDRLDPVG